MAGGRAWIESVAAEIRTGRYQNMSATYSPDGEYTSVEDIQLPLAQQEPMANQDIIAKARSYIGKFHDGSDVPMLADEIGRRFPDLQNYCDLAGPATSWCGIFIAKILAEFGIRPPHKNDDVGGFMYVDAWLAWGQTIPVGQEQPGDIALFLGNPHHITFVAGDGRYVGGNQSDGVSDTSFRTPDAIRRAPTGEPIIVSVAKRFIGITATVFGGSGDPNNSAYDEHFITDQEFGVALPARLSPRPKVRVWKGGNSVDCDIVDVGPWNTNDPYWQTGTRPQAESGTDKSGRTTNLAGIDLTPAAARAIGLSGKGVVDWEFIGATMTEPEILPRQTQIDLRPLLEALIQLAPVLIQIAQQIKTGQPVTLPPLLPPPAPPPVTPPAPATVGSAIGFIARAAAKVLPMLGLQGSVWGTAILWGLRSTWSERQVARQLRLPVGRLPQVLPERG